MTAKMPDCPSAQQAREFVAIRSAINADLPSAEGRIALSHLEDRFDSIVAATSWSRPTSPEGALFHLLLAFDSLVEAQSKADALPMPRTAVRHLYAVRRFLKAEANLPEEWNEALDWGMPATDDPIPSVDALLEA